MKKAWSMTCNEVMAMSRTAALLQFTDDAQLNTLANEILACTGLDTMPVVKMLVTMSRQAARSDTPFGTTPGFPSECKTPEHTHTGETGEEEEDFLEPMTPPHSPARR